MSEVLEAPVLPASPYRGLAPFEDTELDELLFFGRERERAVIAANLVAARLTVLYGPSGVGKSSVLKAGVARELRGFPEQPLVVVHDFWAEDPVRDLTEAIAARAGAEGGTLLATVESAAARRGDIYILLDQVEAYFVYHGASRALGDALGDLLARADLPVHILVSIREDALARLDAFKGQLPELLANRLRLDHLTRDGGRRAIVGPIERFRELAPGTGVSVEPALVEAVLDGVRTGALVATGRGSGTARDAESHSRVEAPYLQVVMQRLWDDERAAGSRLLRLQTLELLGGPARIVEQHLERALSTLTPAQKELAARMFNQLVTPSGMKIAHGTRDLAGYAGTSEEELEPLLAALSRERILRPVGENGYDAHEIYHDVLAEAVLAWRSRFSAEQALEREREAARRRHRRLFLVASLALAALAVTSAIAVYALAQRGHARTEARSAHARELDADALGGLTVDPAGALRDALAAARLTEARQAEDVLRTTLLASRLRAVFPAGGAVTSAVFSSDATRLLTASVDGKARMYDAGTHRLLRTLNARAPLHGAAFDHAGTLVVTEGDDGFARVWDARSGRPVAALKHDGAVLSAAFTTGGALLVTSSADHTARLWDTSSWRPVAVFHEPGAVRGAAFSPDGSLVVTRGTDRFARVFSARPPRVLLHSLDQGGTVTVAIFSPNGRYLLTAGANKTGRIWDPRSGRLLAELKGHRGRILGAAISNPLRGLVATASSDGDARVWTVPDGQLVTVLLGHKNYVNSVAFSPDGFSLVTTSTDRTARVWQPQTGDFRALLAGHGDSVTSAAFNSTGTAVVTASDDGTARLWDPQVQPWLRLLVRAGGPVQAVAYSPDGSSVALAGPGNVVSIRNAGNGHPLLRIAAHAPVRAVAYGPGGASLAFATGRDVPVVALPGGRVERTLHDPSVVLSVSIGPDGEIVAGSVDGAARIWSARGELERVLRVHGAHAAAVAFSPDGKRVVTATSDAVARVWDVADGRFELTLRGHRHELTSARFSPDGSEIVTASIDHDARVWDSQSGALVRVLRGHFALVSDAGFSPDGRWIVTAGPTTAGLWNARSGELVFFLRGHVKHLTSAVFDPTSRRIVTASVDGTVRTYFCDICGGRDDLIRLAERRLAAGAG
jgi:WD40 repeat protein